MKNTENLIAFFSEHNFKLDELGRVVIDDPQILAEIHGASSNQDAAHVLSNVGCSNSAC